MRYQAFEKNSTKQPIQNENVDTVFGDPILDPTDLRTLTAIRRTNNGINNEGKGAFKNLMQIPLCTNIYADMTQVEIEHLAIMAMRFKLALSRAMQNL